MPRRRALTTAQLDELFALPTELNTLVRYWTLAGTDLAAIHRRRRDRNRLGFALQLCALRYPGRLLGPGELIPAEALRFVAHQVDTTPEALAAYAARFQTRYEQLDAVRPLVTDPLAPRAWAKGSSRRWQFAPERHRRTRDYRKIVARGDTAALIYPIDLR